ncbi:hypothetical protein CRYUN_Cryun29cG0100300 [Craigia yunnanensis]
MICVVDIDVGDKNERILKLDSIGNGGVIWKDADVLVFNTWNRWLQTGKKQSSRDWADPNAKNCKRQTRPVPRHKYPRGPHPAEAVLKRALGRVSKSVHLFNVIV